MATPRHPGGPVEYPYKADRAGLPAKTGRSPWLAAQSSLPERSIYEVGIPDPAMMFVRQPQTYQSLAVTQPDPHRRWIQVTVPGGERVDARVDELDEPGPRLDIQVGGVEQGPVQ